MRPVLVLLAHPALQKSRVNRPLADTAAGLSGVTLHDLYERYPDFHIDVEHEQQLLTQHEVLVFQFPVFWFGVPSLLKEWMDVVWSLGFAYGRGGRALQGKAAVCAVTTGGSEATYRHEGANRHPLPELLIPLTQAMRVCGLRPLPPRVIYGTHRLKADDLRREAAAYARWLESLRDGTAGPGAEDWPFEPPPGTEGR